MRWSRPYSDRFLFELRAIENLWDYAGKAARYSFIEYVQALLDVYQQHGAPFGANEEGFRIWMAYAQATTSS